MEYFKNPANKIDISIINNLLNLCFHVKVQRCYLLLKKLGLNVGIKALLYKNHILIRKVH